MNNTTTYLLLNGIKIDAQHLNLVQDDQIRMFLEQWWNDELVVEVKTSGSTGIPKTILLEKKKMLASAAMTISYFNLKKNTRALLCLPTQYIAGKLMLVRAMLGEWDLISVEPSSNPLEKINESEHFGFCAMTPMQVSRILSDPASKIKLENIDQLIIGGGETSAELIRQIQPIKTKCYSTYGMTETITHVAIQKLNGEDKSEVFSLMKGVNAYTDERNCLVIEAAHLSDEKIVTNDLVEFVDFKKFKWLGRYDNIINSGGIKLVPEELEKQIAPLLNDRRFYLCGASDVELGQKLILVVEGPQPDSATTSLLLNHLRESMGKNNAPREIRSLNSFMLTETGKIKRILPEKNT